MRFIDVSLLSLALAACAPTLAQIKADSFNALRAKCDAGDAPSCLVAGSNAEQGYGSPKDPRAALGFRLKALELSQKRCVKNGARDGCMLLNSLGWALEKADPQAAQRALQAACDADDLQGCNSLASRVDAARAHELRARVCLAAEQATEQTSASDLGAMSSACQLLTIDLMKQQGSMDARLGAVKLDIAVVELRMESSESAWLGQDQSLLAGKRRLQELEEMNRLAAQEKEDRDRTFNAIMGGLSSGLAWANDYLQQSQNFYASSAKTIEYGRQVQAQRDAAKHAQRYVPPPPPAGLSNGSAPGQQLQQSQQSQLSQQAQSQQAQADAQRRKAERDQCLAQKVPHMTAVRTNPFPALISHYQTVRHNVTSTCAPPRDFKECMSVNAITWPDDQAANAYEDLERKCKEINKLCATSAYMFRGLRESCIKSGKTTCLDMIDSAISTLEHGEKTFFDTWAAADELRDQEAQRTHDDDCKRRFPL